MTTDLRMILKGVTDSRWPGKVVHYRGIRYATIQHRFSSPLLNETWLEKQKEFIRFGPRCPQPPCDLHTCLHIPPNLPTNVSCQETEDELGCANLNVTCPSITALTNLPVLVWIYGGSQANTFGSATQKIGDTGPLVAQSIDQQKPIVLVTLNHRTNLFAFGDREGNKNLDLQDQRVAIRWVKENIARFGGDPDNITLGGQSIGGVYVHALLATGSAELVQRAILASGNLYTTPPQSAERCIKMISIAEDGLMKLGLQANAASSPNIIAVSIFCAESDVVLQTIKNLGIRSMWMWPEADLADWKDHSRTFGSLKGVMLGECEFEASEDVDIVSKLSVANIAGAFQTKENDAGNIVAKAYGVDTLDDRACKSGTLQFINDAYYACPTHSVVKNLENSGVKVYQYYFDQVNPFLSPEVARAHHAVDLFAIFGGYDGFVNKEMKAVGYDLRTRWIDFINGYEPWTSKQIYAFGPHGQGKELKDEEIASRRRVNHFQAFDKSSPSPDIEIRQNLNAAIVAMMQRRQGARPSC